MLRPAVHPGGRLGRDPADRLGPVGRPAADGPRRGGRGRRRCPRTSSTASTSRCSTCPTRSRRSGRRSPRPAARWWSTTPARSGWTPTCRWWCPRSTRTTCGHRPKGIISNPNCTTLSMIVAVGALHRAFGLRGAGRRLLPGGLRRRARPASTRCTTQLDKVVGHPDPRPAGRRRARGGRRPRAVPRAAGAERGAVGRLAQGRTAGRPRS